MYQIASVQSSTPIAEHENHEDRDEDPDDDEDLAPQAGAAATGPSHRPDGARRLPVAFAVRRTARAVVVAIAAVAVVAVVAVVPAVVAVVIPARRSGAIVAGRLSRLTTAELVQELVEHVSHGVASIADWRPEAGLAGLPAAEALDGSAEAGEDHVGQLVLAEGRRAGRLPAERGPDRGRYLPRPGRVVGGNDGRDAD